MSKQSTNSNCKFYNWGGDGTPERPLYPTVYGSRCEFYDEFLDTTRIVQRANTETEEGGRSE